ncbi:MAG TPA: hypothetical protein DDZ51_02600 [Planctomycetaceae bacterium]|nr:hypothetical protein [Planctomycetaceae bacterium]
MNDGPFLVFSRILLVLACAASSLATLAKGTTAYGEEAFEPYDVYVDQDEVVARCGPGGDYYRTDPLRHGQRLEVYLETPDGWLGVRPPENSFCWVPADSIALDRRGNMGSVTEAGTLAWIGTHLGRARKYMWQVQLSKGEEVAVLGRAEREGPDGPQMWYRISPPAGEFRWVHRDQVVDNPEMLLRNKPRPGELMAAGVPTPLEDDGIEPLAIPEPAAKKAQKGLMATAKSILLNGADEYSPSVAVEKTNEVRNDFAAAPLRPMNERGAIPIAANAPSSDLSFAQSQSLAAQTAETENSQFAQPQAMQVQYDLAAGRRAVGSGVVDDGYGNHQIASQQQIARATLPPQVSIASQPMVRTIGAAGDETAGNGAAQASGQAAVPTGSDANWVRGSARPQQPGTNTGIAPVNPQSGQLLQIPIPPAHSQTPLPAQMLIPNRQNALPNAQQGAVQTVASQDGFQSAQSRSPVAIVGGTVDSLQLELSRRMVATAPAADVEPILQAAQRIAQTDASETERQRARLLAQRIEQYQSIARRRDGDQPASAVSSLQAAARSAGTVTIPPGQVMISGGNPSGVSAIAGPTGGSVGAVEAAGYLVQVYSARPDSPPFALTDGTGRTTHYVSPTPGVNLRRYLNQHISIGGQSGYETGLDTPHIIANAAVRSPEMR